MGELSEGQKIMLACLDVSKQMQNVCRKLEGIIGESVMAGEMPRIDASQPSAKLYTTAGLLLMLCGILADDDEELKAMMSVASLLKQCRVISPDEADKIRNAIDELFDELGLRRTRHLWN
jgi:hypothetical protein